MKQRLADYIADFLVSRGITDCFTVTGGGAMHLNDAFGHKQGLHCTYNHHEQASAIAAEAYARYTGKPALVCVTTGPGATNAITGVVCAWQGSVPMIVISGQVRYKTSVYSSGLPLRIRGIQEFDIIGSVHNMTKYCAIVTEPEKIRWHLEKALHEAASKRPGPVWLDIPLDVQAAFIETDALNAFIAHEDDLVLQSSTVDKIFGCLEVARRPLILAGNGIRTAGAHDEFLALIELLKIPVVTTLASTDAFPTQNEFFIGKCGTLGDYAGNYAVAQCDLLISIGSRLSFSITDFEPKSWCCQAYKIVCDIDENELAKNDCIADMKVCCSAKELISCLLKNIKNSQERKKWLELLHRKKQDNPLVLEKHYADNRPNIYVFYEQLAVKLPSDAALVVSVGSARTVGSKAFSIKTHTRFITNSATATMGYDLPALIGVCSARNSEKTVLVTGEGSIQMNLQEFQTLVHNKYNCAIFVLNNGGYHSIRLTQRSYFDGNFVGVGDESGDISFPDMKKIAAAYEIPFRRCSSSQKLSLCIDFALHGDGLKIVELMLSTNYIIEPKMQMKFIHGGGGGYKCRVVFFLPFCAHPFAEAA